MTKEHVFLYGGRTIERLDRAFKAAVKRAGIKDFRFHDLSHTAASHLFMRGACLKEVQEILLQEERRLAVSQPIDFTNTPP